MLLFSKKISIEFNIDKSVPSLVITDGIRYNQLLSNLISNAFKFSNEGSKVTINITSKDIPDDIKKRNVTFEITDTGRGISKEIMKDLFKPYVQERHCVFILGTGLGLAISQRVTTLFGGTIGVVSEFGIGSSFTVCIPMEIYDDTKKYRMASPNRNVMRLGVMNTVRTFFNFYHDVKI